HRLARRRRRVQGLLHRQRDHRRRRADLAQSRAAARGDAAGARGGDRRAAPHEEPQVPNYGKPKRREKLVPGLTLAIEPMVNIGGPETKTLSDKWTIVTLDGSRSAHFEHTVAITENGPV